jgi:trehalose 6-phosphate phosphatase
MVSNSRTVALLTPDADVVWMCHPQADSAAVFSRLLGDATTGHFAIGPQREALPLIQRYVTGTLTVQTRWASPLVTDYLSHDVGAGRTDLIRPISGQPRRWSSSRRGPSSRRRLFICVSTRAVCGYLRQTTRWC